MAEGLSLEVVMATSEQQVLVALKVEEGATVADAIVASGIGSG